MGGAFIWPPCSCSPPSADAKESHADRTTARIETLRSDLTLFDLMIPTCRF